MKHLPAYYLRSFDLPQAEVESWKKLRRRDFHISSAQEARLAFGTYFDGHAFLGDMVDSEALRTHRALVHNTVA